MKNIGKVNALYPTPVTIVGTTVDGKINWINIAHVGIIGINEIILSIIKHIIRIVELGRIKPFLLTL